MLLIVQGAQRFSVRLWHQGAVPSSKQHTVMQPALPDDCDAVLGKQALPEQLFM